MNKDLKEEIDETLEVYMDVMIFKSIGLRLHDQYITLEFPNGLEVQFEAQSREVHL